MKRAPLIVAIDGPGGVGKSSVARAVAGAVGIPYLDTGAMYRALGLELVDAGLDATDRVVVERVAAGLDLGLEEMADGRIRVLVRSEPLSLRSREPEVSVVTSKASMHPGVRRRMVELQRRWAARRGAVVEGRDIGTKVFPDTPYKFFLEASVEERARRRIAQWRAAGRTDFDPLQLIDEIRRRDHRDSTRLASPMTSDDSYIHILTDELTEDQVVARILDEIDRFR